MNWDAIGAIGEVTGAITVVITLIYLSIQVRQNTRSMDETRKVEIGRSVQSRTELRFELHRTILGSDDLLNAMAKLRIVQWPQSKEVYEQLSPSEKESFYTWSRMQILILDGLRIQKGLDLMSDEIHENIDTAIRRWGPMWNEIGALTGMSLKFIEEVDKTLMEDTKLQI